MQSYCVDQLGATCAFVVVFPNSIHSGNPGNCGNACSCASSVRSSGVLKDLPRPLPSPPFEREATLTRRRNALPCHLDARIQSAWASRLEAVLVENRILDVLAQPTHGVTPLTVVRHILVPTAPILAPIRTVKELPFLRKRQPVAIHLAPVAFVFIPEEPSHH